MESAATTTKTRATTAQPSADGPTSSPAIVVPSADAAPIKRKRRPFLILGVIAALVLAGIGIYMLATAGKESTDDAQVSTDMVPIDGAGRRGSSLVVPVVDNQPVKRGDLLAQINPADYENKVKQAEAELSVGQGAGRGGRGADSASWRRSRRAGSARRARRSPGPQPRPWPGHNDADTSRGAGHGGQGAGRRGTEEGGHDLRRAEIGAPQGQRDPAGAGGHAHVAGRPRDARHSG